LQFESSAVLVFAIVVSAVTWGFLDVAIVLSIAMFSAILSFFEEHSAGCFETPQKASHHLL
jgi:hypothetical protein